MYAPYIMRQNSGCTMTKTAVAAITMSSPLGPSAQRVRNSVTMMDCVAVILDELNFLHHLLAPASIATATDVDKLVIVEPFCVEGFLRITIDTPRAGHKLPTAIGATVTLVCPINVATVNTVVHELFPATGARRCGANSTTIVTSFRTIFSAITALENTHLRAGLTGEIVLLIDCVTRFTFHI
jgi:hypothetical protein